jgi:hypothetical protein
VLLLGLGLLLLVAAVRQWRGRPSGGEEPATPGWMRTIDEFTIAKAAGAGFALSALNPKNLLLTAAAALKRRSRALRARTNPGLRRRAPCPERAVSCPPRSTRQPLRGRRYAP